MIEARAPPLERAARPISKRRAWYILLLLATLLLSSYIDRFILTVLAQPMGAELDVSDKQIGLLMGFGFSTCFAIVGLPLAYLLDRNNRIRIVALAALLWGSASLVSAFAPNFVSLVAFRGLIAIGEAALTPAAVSLIPDLFAEPKRRALPISIYFSVSVAGATLTYIIGGAALDIATRLSPFIHLTAWRGAIALSAIPGLLLATLLWLTVSEPVRATIQPTKGIASGDSREAPHFRQNIGFYLPFYLALFACTTTPLAVHAWLPTALTRQYGLSISHASYWLGITGTLGGVLGAFAWPFVATRITRQADDNSAKLVLMMIATIGGGGVTLLFLYPDVRVTILSFGLFFALFGAHAPLGALILQSSAPAGLRARAMSISTLVSILGAYSVGPLLVPGAATLIIGKASALIGAMAIVATMMTAIGVLALVVALRATKRGLARTRNG